ncbi:MAG: RNA-binding S4 domain-containing protein [Alphaproteobacteria bacterium]|nr:RNA-binding S4 domain-containing protein [Alphaproteobacteria bacterium]
MTQDAVLRLDKWLWYARFFKTRTQATKIIQSSKLRINGELTNKPHRAAVIGMVLTFQQGDRIRVIKIVAMGSGRGPATEAATLYEDLSPVIAQSNKDSRTPKMSFEMRQTGAGRPTKKHRRETERLKDTI